MDKSGGVKVESFGCRLNALEGDVVARAAQQAGLNNATIINGCAVTSEAMRQAGQAARKAKRADPDAKIIVTGCAAQTDAARFSAMPEVDLVLGNEEKLSPAAYGAQSDQVSDIMTLQRATPLLDTSQTARARAFVQVQTGCDHRCTFCIIPFGRGNSRSVPIDQVVSRCRRLVADGHKEIVLTGVDVTSYGPDIGEAGLGALVKAILDGVPDLPRLRLSSIDAVEIDQGLLDMVIHEPRLMPHLHLSLQAGDDMILKRMKRRHSRQQAIDFCNKLKSQRPDIAFGADIIAGFPTETEAMFAQSEKLVAECDLVWLHVFPYSQRPGTPAERMPQVPRDEIKARAARLRAAGERQRINWLEAQIGQTMSVLIEQAGIGRSENFARIACDENLPIGEIASVTIIGHNQDMLQAER
jgi:threonylcarbamoyladenosine tRNA methylthiotransferase MtaB